MFEILILIIGIICIGILVYANAAAGPLPPKAKLICDIWESVEDDQKKYIMKGEATWNCMTSYT